MNGFRILNPVHLHGWRQVPIPQRLDYVPLCPCCAILEPEVVATACTLRIGQCTGCGWLGYVDRPQADWFSELYADNWDTAGRENAVGACMAVNAGAREGAAYLKVIRHHLPPQTCKKVLEIGAGWGIGVHELRRSGYQATGVEPSEFRRGVASACLGIDLAPRVSQVDGTYDLIYSHHVLEHVADLEQFFEDVRGLQDRDGTLYIQVPNAEYEPVLGQLLFVPHLHSFSLEALQALMTRQGYDVRMAMKLGGDIAVIGQRRPSRPLRYEPRLSYRNRILQAFQGSPCRYFAWEMKLGQSGWFDAPPPAEMEGQKWRCLEVEPFDCGLSTVIEGKGVFVK